jgi:hypothetical protein
MALLLDVISVEIEPTAKSEHSTIENSTVPTAESERPVEN